MTGPQSLGKMSQSPTGSEKLSVDTTKAECADCIDCKVGSYDPLPILAQALQKVGFENPLEEEAQAEESAEIKRRIFSAMDLRFRCENEDQTKRDMHEHCKDGGFETDSTYEGEDSDSNEAFEKIRIRSPIPIYGEDGVVIGETTFDGVRCGGAVAEDWPGRQDMGHFLSSDASNHACGCSHSRSESDNTVQPSRNRPRSYVETELEETFGEINSAIAAFSTKIIRLFRTQEVRHLNHICDLQKAEESLDSIKECVYASLDGQSMMFKRINDLEQSMKRMVHSHSNGTRKEKTSPKEIVEDDRSFLTML